MSTTAGKRRKRTKLAIEQNWRCYYCNCVMVDYVCDPVTGRPAPNAVTLEHLRDKFDPDRGRNPKGRRVLVAACVTCNNARGRERLNSMPIELVHEYVKIGHNVSPQFRVIAKRSALKRLGNR